jgi:ribosomal protein L11 methyltransferase
MPVEYNDFIFYGDHFKERIKYKKNKIRLNSSDAFGSGAHPTTEGCIKAIKFINKKIKINSFLDIGSGSGILSICASKYWKNAQIYGVDIDKTSIIRSRLNIKNNNLKSRIRFELVHPKTSLNFKYKSEFDLVVANIITSELSLLARYIEKKIKKNGYLVLSGILDYQLKIILSKFRNFNLILNKKIYISSWVTIILKKEVKYNEAKYLP